MEAEPIGILQHMEIRAKSLRPELMPHLFFRIDPNLIATSEILIGDLIQNAILLTAEFGILRAMAPSRWC
jgi:hypothetical protein